MAGIYIHIPYCKQACHYCDFHFSTNLNTKSDLIEAILKEIEIQKNYLGAETVETIYFGGGTPSMLSSAELVSTLAGIRQNFNISESAEITLEANPDDLSQAKLTALKKAGINRLSIGIQSFDNDLLTYFNRAHDAHMATKCVQQAQALGFKNLSIDLIFGAPSQSTAGLKKDLEQALLLKTPHISIYGLTIEKDTVFGKWEKQNKLKPMDEDIAAEHLELIMTTLSAAGYVQYEISNFCLPGFESKHNSSYWHGKKYLGLGPAAHSYNGEERQFNLAHNSKYIRQIQAGKLPTSIEKLTPEDQINEYLLTKLRLIEGVNHQLLLSTTGFDLLRERASEIDQFVEMKMLETNGDFVRLTTHGKLLADFITEKLII
ncbi:radical SAM family heme chaperone HemW [Reichenbachiella carrageenanivorans]|uniref:Heme chaperone HemW n=1 Tax=Reichenbachiella carrageenanivorans TaxID=2979869 RepID=A0ABY6D1W6_9BACT|nr:radical SAM family heme chaperone HemW [Reichenbachiella carrageenanivorans]UXX80161.1 radical SAM family heme chaperone HemW [Reichenbachiella carrageenanivorans]